MKLGANILAALELSCHVVSAEVPRRRYSLSAIVASTRPAQHNDYWAAGPTNHESGISHRTQNYDIFAVVGTLTVVMHMGFSPRHDRQGLPPITMSPSFQRSGHWRQHATSLDGSRTLELGTATSPQSPAASECYRERTPTALLLTIPAARRHYMCELHSFQSSSFHRSCWHGRKALCTA